MIKEVVINLITSLCLIYMIGIVGYFIYKACATNREGRLKLIKSFSKGKFILIYFVAVPLYWLAQVYEGVAIGGAFLNAIRYTIEIVIVKFNYSATDMLMNDSIFFRVTMDICRALVMLNATIFVVGILGQKIFNHYMIKKADKSKKPTYVIVGYNDENKAIIKSIIARKDGEILLFAENTDEIKDYAYVNCIGHVPFKVKDDFAKSISAVVKDFAEQKINIIINTQRDEDNLVIVKSLSTLIIEKNLEKFDINNEVGLSCFVFGEPENVATFTHFATKTKEVIRYVNKYKLIAMDFVGSYPITHFMKEEISTETATIKEDVDVNIALIGFGKTNHQIFLTSVANNQVMTIADGKLQEKVVNYYIFDKNKSNQNKNLNHDYFRYGNFLKSANQEEYLTFPAKTANEKFYKLDVNDERFYLRLEKGLRAKAEGRKAFNYVVIAYGSDMENIDFADKITEKLNEWGLKDNTKVFVKVRNTDLNDNVIAGEYVNDGRFITFGGEEKSVYNINSIKTSSYEGMAKARHLCYKSEDKINELMQVENKEEALKKIYEDAVKKWYEWHRIQRESNVYACLSIRLKLNLLGYDYEKGEWDEEVAKEMMDKYQLNDKIQYVKGLNAPGKKYDKPIVDYGDCNFIEGTVRNNYAQQEHLRWNAYEISCGVLPASIEEIKTISHRELVAVRKHANLTTFDGLLDYRRIIAEKDGKTEKEVDVIKYDYQIMDDVCWILKDNGYKVVRR